MHELTGSPLLSFDGAALDGADAVLLALLDGSWQQVERRLAAGMALLADAEDRGDPPAEEAVRAATVVFRRERRLLAAEELREWLEERGLEPRQLAAQMRREVVLARDADRRLDALATWRPSDAALAAELAAGAMISGAFAAAAHGLVRACAARHLLGEDPPVREVLVDALLAAALAPPDRGLRALPRDVLVAKARDAVIRDASRRRVGATIDDAALDRGIEARRLEWTTLRFDELELPTDGAAREAVLCVREDAMALAQVAAHADVAVATREEQVSGLDRATRAALVAANPGELVGPLGTDGGFRLLALRERRAPSRSDAAVRERLRDELVIQRLARAAAGRVEWHGDI